MMRLLFVVAALAVMLASALGVVIANHNHRAAFIALEALEVERQTLETDYGRLQLERAALTADGILETVAAQRLGLLEPEVSELVVLD